MTVALKRLIDPRRPITYGIVQAGEDVPDGIHYIRPVDMTDRDGVVDERRLRRTTPDIANSYRRSTVRRGDVVVSIGPSYGKVMIVPASLEGANLTQGTARLAPAPFIQPRYLYWLLQTPRVRSWWSAAVGGSTFAALNLGPLSETPMPKPLALDEQWSVTQRLDTEVAAMNAIVNSSTVTGGPGALDRLAKLLDERRLAVLASALSDAQVTIDKLKGHSDQWLHELL